MLNILQPNQLTDKRIFSILIYFERIFKATQINRLNENHFIILIGLLNVAILVKNLIKWNDNFL